MPTRRANMDLNKKKEEVQLSCMMALCASQGIDLEIMRHDSDSTDMLIKKLIETREGRYNAQLRIQLKATSSISQYRDAADRIEYKLKAKNYNDLCTLATTPAILVLMILPNEEKEWIKWTLEDILIKCRMYYRSFEGCEKTGNTDSIQVKIPKANYINGEVLQKLLVKVATGELS